MFLTCLLTACQGWCIAGEKILSICERGDKLLDEEVAKVYKGKKIPKGRPSKISTPSIQCSS